VAVNCSVVPAAIDGACGVTEIEVSSGAVTVNAAEPPMAPEVAVIVAVPCATPAASPPLTVATEVDDEVQVAVVVRFWVEPSL
jgi:hypothetical protein